MSKFLLLILFIGIASVDYASANSVHDYLDKRLKQSKVEIAKIHIQDDPPVEVKSYKLQSDKLWNKTLGSDRVFLTSMHDKVFVFERDRVLILGDSVPLSKQTSALREITRMPRDNAIKFIRSIVWKSVLYLLVCYETGSCSLYTGSDSLQLRHRQTIRHRGLPVDASFFTRDNQLYLVVADNSGAFTAPSVIYDWRGTYMDMVLEIFTTAAVSVATFKHKQSTIIVFAQNDENNHRVGSLVFEFKDNTVQRVQFLSTVNPISVHHYNYGGFNFVLLVNQNSAGSLYWWDGQELLRWMELPEIGETDFNRVENIRNETYFFISQNNILQLYKVQSAVDCTLVGSLKLGDNQSVVDMEIQTNDSMIIAILVVRNEENEYSLESWELLIKEASHGSLSTEKDVTSKCLAELIEILSQRMPSVRQASSSWATLYPSSENLTISKPISLPNLILESGSVDSINLVTPQEIISPMKIRKTIENLIEDVQDVLAASKDIPFPNKTNSLIGNIVVRGDVLFDELHVDSLDVDFWNEVDLRKNSVVSARSVEQSANPLRGKSIVVEDLEVDSLCGIPSEFWARRNDSSRIPLNITSTKVDFLNDTVLLHANVSLPELKVQTLNNVDVQEFLDNVFIYGTGQIINGNITYTNSVKVTNLTTQFFNGISADSLMDTSSDQSFDEFFIKTIKIDKLYADFVNGVPVNESARVSQRNVIKGEVNLATLQVTEELIMDMETKSEKSEFLQVYDNVTIEGNVRVKSINLKNMAIVSINNEQINTEDIFTTYWTKSTDQVIKNKAVFDRNLIIDELNAEYINGLSKQDFLYTSIKEIPQSFINLHFEHLHVDDTFLLEDDNSSLIEFGDDTLTFRKELHIERLRTNNLLVNFYNGVPVSQILNNFTGLVFTDERNYPIINAKRVNVTDLYFDLLNNERAELLENNETTNDDRRIDFTNATELQVEELNVEYINGVAMEKFDEFNKGIDSLFKNLIIDGDLIVKNNLEVNLIEDRSAKSYLEQLVEEVRVISSEEEFENLTVGTATFNLLHGRNVDTFFEELLSRTREQFIPGNISFHKILANDLNTGYINNEDASKLIWIDEPIMFLGNVTIDGLLVEGDIITKKLNGHNPKKLYDSLLNIPIKNISVLKVDGKISWDNSSTDSNSIFHFLENAVTKDKEQTIHGDIIFEDQVTVSVFNGTLEQEDAIREIVLDAVTDDGEVIKITGKKILKDNLFVNELSVANYVNISTINNVDIVDFNNSIVRKYEEIELDNHITFLNEVKINELHMGDHVHGAPISKIALLTDTLPSNVVFKNLEVLENVYVKSVDGVDLDKFLNRRVTLNGNHTIHSDVQFNGFLDVTGNAEISKINSIDPSDFVLNGVEETQFISGSKVFESDLIVTGNVQAPLVNNINVLSEHKNGVATDEDTEIYGDLTFQGKVNVKNVSASQLVNGVNLHSVANGSQALFDSNPLQENGIIEERVADLFHVANTLRNKFMYIEEDESLKIHLPNVKAIEPVYFENVVRLNIFGEESGPTCGLPVNCYCSSEYTAEYTKDDCNIEKANDSIRVWNFHEPHAAIGIRIESNTVSYSPECTLEKNREEITTISWMKIGRSNNGDTIGFRQNIPLKIQGFIKDTQIFMIDNEAYVVLASYYDPILKTHRTKSPIYKLNFETGAGTLHQEILTDGAWDIQAFNINSDAYLLMACFGESSQSYLYKFDPSLSQFLLLRTFGGKSRHVKSLSQQGDHFIFLEDFRTSSIVIYSYDAQTKNFYSYQNLFFDSKVNGIECFHSDAIGSSDSFVILTTQNGEFFVYEYMFAQRFQVVLHSWVDNVQTMMPFHYSGHRYIFAGTKNNSTIFRIVQAGPFP